MSAPRLCTLERGQASPRFGVPGFLLRTPYDEELRLAILALDGERVWTGDAWWIAAALEPAVVALVVERFGGLTIINPGGAADEVVDRAGRSVQARLL